MKFYISSNQCDHHEIIQNAFTSQNIVITDKASDADSIIIIEQPEPDITAPLTKAKPCFYIGQDKNNPRHIDTLKAFSPPFKIGKVIASIISASNNYQEKKPTDIGTFQFDPTHHLLTDRAANKTFKLTEKETAIIQCLLTTHPQTVERQALLTEVWEYAPDAETHTVETHIYRLRQKIGQGDDEKGLIVTTERGYGLNFE